MSEFDLNKLVTEQIETSGEADPHVIANRLLMQMSAKECREALSQCLGGHVRVVIGRLRMNARAADEVQPTVGTSKRARAINELDLAVYLGDEWKILGDCTSDDLERLAAQHDVEADKHAALRDRYARYAQLVRESGQPTLRDVFAAARKAAA